jgi:hypothetical protein
MATIRHPALPEGVQIRFNPRLILFGVGALFVLIGLFSGIYQVPANSVAVIQRFGGYLKTAPPGLHFKLPWGIDSAIIVEVQRQQKLERKREHDQQDGEACKATSPPDDQIRECLKPFQAMAPSPGPQRIRATGSES